MRKFPGIVMAKERLNQDMCQGVNVVPIRIFQIISVGKKNFPFVFGQTERAGT